MDDTELCIQKSEEFQEGQQQFIQDSNPADSESWGIPEFCKILNGFPGISVKIHNIFGKFLQFQSAHQVFITGFPMSSMGGRGVDIFWNSPIEP